MLAISGEMVLKALFEAEVAAVKKSLASGVCVLAALVLPFGSGSAGANPYDPYAGQTYDKASQSISSSGGTVVIASREGSYLPTEKCVVTGSRNAGFRDSSGNSQGNKVLLDLNCNDTSALNGHPGNSVATPEGKTVLQARETAKSLNEDYAASAAAGKQSYCELNADNCRSFCQSRGAGLCSAELLQALSL